MELVRELLPEGDYRMQEERRLFYVGMTRARDELVLTHAADYGGQRARRVSPFVLEALDLPVAEGAAGFGARPPRRRWSGSPSFATPARRAGRRAARSDEPLIAVVLRDRRLPHLPAEVQYGHVLRVPLAPHHSIIYGAALHAAVQEFHKRHARGDVMTRGAAVRRVRDAPGRTRASCRASTRRRASTPAAGRCAGSARSSSSRAR